MVKKGSKNLDTFDKRARKTGEKNVQKLGNCQKKHTQKFRKTDNNWKIIEKNNKKVQKN